MYKATEKLRSFELGLIIALFIFCVVSLYFNLKPAFLLVACIAVIPIMGITCSLIHKMYDYEELLRGIKLLRKYVSTDDRNILEAINIGLRDKELGEFPVTIKMSNAFGIFQVFDIEKLKPILNVSLKNEETKLLNYEDKHTLISNLRIKLM